MLCFRLCLCLLFIVRQMYTVYLIKYDHGFLFCFCFFVSSLSFTWLIYPYASGLLHFHWRNHANTTMPGKYRQTSNMSHTLVDNKFVDHSDAVGASPVGAAGPRSISRTKASDAELLLFALICVWINGSVYNSEAGDLRRYRTHYDTKVMNSSQTCELRCY